MAESRDVRWRRLFQRSLNPMLIVDDERRCVDANAAACLFLRLTLEGLRALRVDDLTPARMRPELDARWLAFLRSGGSSQDVQRTVPWELQLPDGTVVPIDLGGVPHLRPGRHLAILLFPAARALNEQLDRTSPPAHDVLTRREREVLTLVALGNTGTQIAAQLFLSPATVQTHVARALVKLRAKNRAHGIALALSAGMLDVGDGLEHPVRYLDAGNGGARLAHGLGGLRGAQSTRDAAPPHKRATA